ncbi:aspartate-semialdehyde dehydrogenase [Pseudomonas sp. C27(2019)]|uniref:aspartate-semialdehyde dehydrogenase n=1 Tax=Pseudomonas sp. C27(2019) TaxID=2604941 RepID=UPI0012462082|nr:aspartate-semialdehyde dehydrogenase [Pseudomonas sp. C27(2019)]QEY58317.1 aspartate-semialdehyde dehydrogenase [Pseudomonas sp. C27(2019)]
MLPPIPQGLVPVTSQHDVAKPQPAVAPVVPVQESAKGSAVSLDRDEVAAAQERARQEQRRRQQQREAERDEAGEAQQIPAQLVEDESRELSRKGLWVDISV